MASWWLSHMCGSPALIVFTVQQAPARALDLSLSVSCKCFSPHEHELLSYLRWSEAFCPVSWLMKHFLGIHFKGRFHFCNYTGGLKCYLARVFLAGLRECTHLVTLTFALCMSQTSLQWKGHDNGGLKNKGTKETRSSLQFKGVELEIWSSKTLSSVSDWGLQFADF